MSFLQDLSWLQRVGWWEVLQTAGIGFFVGGTATALNHIFINPPNKEYEFIRSVGLELPYLRQDTQFCTALEEFASQSGVLAFIGSDSRARRKRNLRHAWETLLLEADAVRFQFFQVQKVSSPYVPEVLNEAQASHSNFLFYLEEVMKICGEEMSRHHTTEEENDRFQEILSSFREGLVHQFTEYVESIQKHHRMRCGM